MFGDTGYTLRHENSRGERPCLRGWERSCPDPRVRVSRGLRRVATVLTLTAVLVLLAGACGSTPPPPADRAMEEYLRGQDLEARGNLERAFEAYNASIQIHPSAAEVYAARGYIYLRFNSTAPALADLNRAVELDPEMTLAYYYRGLLLATGIDYDQALLNFTKAIQLDPDLADAYFQRAKIAFEENEDHEAAIEDLSAAIELTPDSANLYLTRGTVYLIAEDVTRGIADLEQVLALTQDEALVVGAKELLSRVR